MRKKTHFLLTALCTAVYFIGYLTRYDLAVSLTEMAQSLQVPQRSIALAVTGIFITYGIGQVGSGLLGDHFSPHILIGIGLGGTTICNAIVAGTQSVTLIVAAWWINGFSKPCSGRPWCAHWQNTWMPRNTARPSCPFRWAATWPPF